MSGVLMHVVFLAGLFVYTIHIICCGMRTLYEFIEDKNIIGAPEKCTNF